MITYLPYLDPLIVSVVLRVKHIFSINIWNFIRADGIALGCLKNKRLYCQGNLWSFVKARDIVLNLFRLALFIHPF